MNKLIPVIAVVSLLVCGNVFAYSVQPLPPKGRIKIADDDGSAPNKNSPKKSTAKKADLPPAVDVPALDASKTDKAIKELSLTDDQQKRIETAKAGVEEEIKKLATAQKDARAAYDKADADGAAAAAALVMKAASACKSFNPNQRFEDIVSGILTMEQRIKYRTELKKA